jgi:hypothetical protein
MEQEHPLAFRGDGANELPTQHRTPEVYRATRKVIASLEPLNGAERARVIRAVMALLALD